MVATPPEPWSKKVGSGIGAGMDRSGIALRRSMRRAHLLAHALAHHLAKERERREPLNAHGWFDDDAGSARAQAQRCGVREIQARGAGRALPGACRPQAGGPLECPAHGGEARLVFAGGADRVRPAVWRRPCSSAWTRPPTAHFALAVTEHRTRHVPGAIEKLRPIVDLRSLAMQGIMSPEELSLCGQARALAQWHENARCCGHCGGTTLVKDGGLAAQVLGLRPGMVPAHRSGRDHADHRRQPLPAGARAPLRRQDVLDARRLHRARRGHRARRAPRGDGGDRHQGGRGQLTTRASRGPSRTPSCWAASAGPRPPRS